MNHIDEGLWILKQFSDSEYAQRAFALHPLIQDDSSLKAFFSSHDVEQIDQKVLMLAMEYRWVANNYLSFHESRNPSDIVLSPLEDVQMMLIADKVQNRKDFEKYHLGKHARSDRLEEYFKEWLERLGVTEERYENLISDIHMMTGEDMS